MPLLTACVVTNHPLVSDARAGSVAVIRAFVSERSRKEDKQQSSSLHLLDRVRELVEYYGMLSGVVCCTWLVLWPGFSLTYSNPMSHARMRIT